MSYRESNVILTTERLILRTWTPKDVYPMSLISTDPQVMEYFPYIQDLKATERLVEHINQHQLTYGYALYAVEIKNTKEFIGFVGLNHPSFDIPHFTPKGMPIVEIGWRLSSTHWNKGYATEAAKAVLGYSFTELNLNEIISFTASGNSKSRKVMEKIGLQHDETDDFDHPKLAEDSPLRKHVLYRLTKDQALIIFGEGYLRHPHF